jgi:hypothetical protein
MCMSNCKDACTGGRTHAIARLTRVQRANADVLLQFMEERCLFETREETMHRIDILSKLRDVVEKWIKLVAAHVGLSEAEIEDAHAVVNTFGSFRLEVHGPGAPAPRQRCLDAALPTQYYRRTTRACTVLEAAPRRAWCRSIRMDTVLEVSDLVTAHATRVAGAYMQCARLCR